MAAADSLPPHAMVSYFERHTMDGTAFDALARQIDHLRWTRRSLAGSAGGALAALLGGGALSGAAALEARKGHKSHHGKKKPKPKKCRGGKIRCRKKCVDSRTDNANCGKCGVRCSPTASGVRRVCQGGTCFPVGACPAATPVCATPTTSTECGVACLCGTSVEGHTLCLENNTTFCANPAPCQNSGDCAPGEACVDVANCCPASPLPPGSTACFAACAAPTPPA